MPRKKPISVKGDFPKPCYFHILPIGEFLNKPIQDAQIGDVIELAQHQGWRKEKFVLLGKSKVAVNTSYFTQLMKAVYGNNMTWQTLENRWKSELLLDGFNTKTWYHDKVLCLTLQPISGDTYLARLEAMEREEEREKALEYAKSMTEEEIRESIQRGEIPPHKDLL